VGGLRLAVETEKTKATKQAKNAVRTPNLLHALLGGDLPLINFERDDFSYFKIKNYEIQCLNSTGKPTIR